MIKQNEESAKKSRFLCSFDKMTYDSQLPEILTLNKNKTQ